MKYLALITILIFSCQIKAECKWLDMEKWAEENKNNFIPDPPGAFGPLAGTVTLDCLKYVKKLKENNKVYALIIDNYGKEYKLEKRALIGMNAKIIDINENHLILEGVHYNYEKKEWYTKEKIMKRKNK